jgi:hypothetical protein
MALPAKSIVPWMKAAFAAAVSPKAANKDAPSFGIVLCFIVLVCCCCFWSPVDHPSAGDPPPPEY